MDLSKGGPDRRMEQQEPRTDGDYYRSSGLWSRGDERSGAERRVASFRWLMRAAIALIEHCRTHRALTDDERANAEAGPWECIELVGVRPVIDRGDDPACEALARLANGIRIATKET